EQFAEGFEEEDDLGSQENLQLSNNRVIDEVVSAEEHNRVGEVAVTQPDLVMDPPAGGVDCVDIRVSPSICYPAKGLSHSVTFEGHEGSLPRSSRSKRTKSCPPAVNRLVLSGPWSLEWLHDFNQGDDGVLFSADKRPRKGGRGGESQQTEGKLASKRRQAGGIFRHTLSSLKKVARLPSKDRGEVLKVLKKNARRHRDEPEEQGSCGGRQHVSTDTSSSSATNDWKHWVVMQGNNQVVADDV
ncbi:DUF4283 domain protein, partial [Trifolium medium]|nr:DUF4283 domain protein [Trifolium medium]